MANRLEGFLSLGQQELLKKLGLDYEIRSIQIPSNDQRYEAPVGIITTGQIDQIEELRNK